MRSGSIVTFLFFIICANFNSIAGSDDSLKIHVVKNHPVNSNEYIRLSIGDTFPDIVLYDSMQQIVPVDSIFKDSKGVIFVTGSYTCPTFRGSVKHLNQMVANQIYTYRVYFVYTQEAHPTKGSPYGKGNNNDKENTRAGIFIEQQKFLEQRIYYCKKAIKDLNVKSEVLVDNEKNDFFWKIFSGPNGFLVFSADKKLVQQQLWYDQPNKKSKKDRDK